MGLVPCLAERLTTPRTRVSRNPRIEPPRITGSRFQVGHRLRRLTIELGGLLITYCHNCGAEVPAAARFCAGCATKVLLPEEKELRPEPPASVSSTPDAGWVPTTTLEHLWYWKPDSELEEALQNLARYTEESQQAIRTEAQRRLTQAKYEPLEYEPGELVLKERPGVYLVMAFVGAGVYGIFPDVMYIPIDTDWIWGALGGLLGSLLVLSPISALVAGVSTMVGG